MVEVKGEALEKRAQVHYLVSVADWMAITTSYGTRLEGGTYSYLQCACIGDGDGPRPPVWCHFEASFAWVTFGNASLIAFLLS